MSRKIPQIWGKKGGVRISDVGWGFFVVKLESVEDYERAMFGGPWMVGDHYIVIQDWRPYFRPEDSTLSTLRVWVRLPGLPLEYFDYGILKRIGDKIGTTVRIDHTTLEGARGNFARICVEVDLSKPLLSKYRLRRRVRRIEYEGLHTICFGCGCYGHEEGACPVVATVEEAPPNTSSFSNPVFVGADLEEERPEVEEDFGPWMKVKRQPRRSQRQPPAASRLTGKSPIIEEVPASKPAQSSAVAEVPIGVKEKGKGNNSFHILEDLEEGSDSGMAVLEGPDFNQRAKMADGNKENLMELGLKPNQGPILAEICEQPKLKVVSTQPIQGANRSKDVDSADPGNTRSDPSKNGVNAGSGVIKPKETPKSGPKKSAPAGTRTGGDVSRTKTRSAVKGPKLRIGHVDDLGGPKASGGLVGNNANTEYVLVEDVTMEEAVPSHAAERQAA
ncbi:hypothetical protein LINPERPRIM_LOCUS14082 [Linum perenne]